MTDIPEGYALIPGRSRKNAAAALAAADAAGVDQLLVSAVDEGYLVPIAVADAYESPSADQEPVDAPATSTPDESWKNADIEAYADAHGIDLDGASKKADMLAAIGAASNKEE